MITIVQSQMMKMKVRNKPCIWDAINGTYKAIQTVVTDSVILDRIETIIKHARTLGKGNYETALRRDVAP